MAYQNVPVSDGYQVVQQIANFAQTTGWTLHRGSEQVDPRGVTYYEITLSATGYSGYVTLAGYLDGGVTLNGHRGYDSAKRWWEQPDQYYSGYDNDGDPFNDQDERYTHCFCDIRVNPTLSVHLFAGMSPTPYVYVAVEMEPGYYRHIVIGHFEKFGTSLGGLFFDVSSLYSASYGSYPGRHRAPFLYNTFTYVYGNAGGFDAQSVDGSPSWVKLCNGTPAGYLVGGHWGSELDTIFKCSPIQFNSRTPLVTPFVWASSGGYVPYGTPPAFRYVSMEYYEAGDEVTIGTDTWKVFPWARRKTGAYNTIFSSTADEATGMFGIAYLKD